MQRLYSKAHSDAAKVEKFARVKAFTKAYPKICKQIQADFDKKPEARVLYLIAKTGFRLGGDEERGEVAAYGASTLKAEHIAVKGNTITFNFGGKSGVEQSHKLTDKRLADYLRDRKRGQLFNVSQDNIRAYLKGTGHGDFLVKDFRTYIANDVALAAIEKMPEPKDEKTLKKAIKAVCEQVAAKLGNQWTMARDSYISPEVWGTWKLAQG
jgi:DNA topoisomerase-1